MNSKRLETFSKDVREAVRRGQNGYCFFCTEKIDEFHHILHNITGHRKLFPRFVHSIFNCLGVCRACHVLRKDEVNITPDMAVEYEQALHLNEDMVEIRTLKEILDGQKAKERQDVTRTETSLP